MVRRVCIGNSGGSFLFRSSQAGNDAVSGDISRMAIYEGQVPMVPKAFGEVDVPFSLSLGASTTVNIPSQVFSYPPFILIKSTDGVLPGTDTIGGWFVAGTTPRLQLYNRAQPGITRRLRWWAFAEL
ncbi:hypothetical protein PH552_12390 [Rhizobium sp. CNPSo 3968]|uniref:hypothetical protein n=1 Tax=Rhizobium sp. CNPSo 3968 TaxID=3021408 RepID=UPI00254C7371|nr:hypothetical protein [Rhizobium sp. CNPSo 3968]MDK4720143.1 hypothetical protein [Rhizobium sp. CNPSo 3968]